MQRQPDNTNDPAVESAPERAAAEAPHTPESRPTFQEAMEAAVREADAKEQELKEGAARIEASAAKDGGLKAEEAAKNKQIVAEAAAVRAEEAAEIKVVAGESPVEFVPAAEKTAKPLTETAKLEAKMRQLEASRKGASPGRQQEIDREMEALTRKWEGIRDAEAKKSAEQPDSRAAGEKSAELAAAELLKKEGFVDVPPAEILKTLDRKDVKELHKLLAEGDDAKVKELLEKQIDKVAEGSEAKERLAEVKAETVAALQDTLRQTLDRQVSAKIMEAMSFKEKVSVFAGPILKKVALNIGLGVGAGIGAAALVGSGGLAAVAAGGAMAGWRLVENSSWGKKMLEKVGLGAGTKKFEDLRSKKQGEIVRNVLNAEALSALVSNAIRQNSSKRLMEQIRGFREQGKQVEEGWEMKLDKFEASLKTVTPEFYRAALAKVKAESPELGPEQAKEAAMLVALTAGRYEKGQAMEDQLRNRLKKEKPGIFAALEKFSAVRSGTAGDSRNEKLIFGAATIALGAATASVARQSRWGRAVTSGIAGGLVGFALGKRAEAKAEARLVEEAENMVSEAESKLEDIDFPSDQLDGFRADAAVVLARLQSGLFDNQPTLKERAENFVFQVDQLEMKHRSSLDGLLETLGKNGDKVSETRQADIAKLDKLYKKGQTRKALYVLGGAALGAVAGYYAQDAVEGLKKQLGLAQTQEAAPAKPGEVRTADSLEPRQGEPGFVNEPLTPEVKLTPEQIEAQELLALGTMRKGEGITHALVRQLEYKAAQPGSTFAAEHGFKGDVTNAAALHKWAVLVSRRLAIENHYINPDGTQVRVRFDAAQPAQYLLDQQKGGKLGVVEQNTEGHEYLWRPRPRVVETPLKRPELESIPKTQLPEHMTPEEALKRLTSAKPDPVLDERLRLNMARGQQTPEDVAWLKSELSKRFETIDGEIKAKTAELNALHELQKKTTDAGLLQRLSAQEAALQERIRVLNEAGKAYHRSFLAPREELRPDLSTGRRPVVPTSTETLTTGGPEAIRVSQQYNLDAETTRAMTAAHLSPERVAVLASEAKKLGLTTNQTVLGESWLSRAGTDAGSRAALRQSLAQIVERGSVAGQHSKINIGGGRTIDYMTGYDAKRAAQWVLEHRLGVKLEAGGHVPHLETAASTVDVVVPPQSQELMSRLAETPFAAGHKADLGAGVGAFITFDQKGHPLVRFEFPKALDPKVYESDMLAEGWRNALSKSPPADLERIQAAAFRAHYASEMLTRLKGTGIDQTEEGRNLLGNLRRDMQSARIEVVRRVDQAAVAQVGEAHHREIIDKIGKYATKPEQPLTTGSQETVTVDKSPKPIKVAKAVEMPPEGRVAHTVEVKKITSGIGGSVEQFSTGTDRVNFVYDTFGRIKGLQEMPKFKLGPADDAAMRALLKPENMVRISPLQRGTVENTARSIYGYTRMASELAAAGHEDESAYLMRLAGDMRNRAIGRFGDVLAPLPKQK